MSDRPNSHPPINPSAASSVRARVLVVEDDPNLGRLYELLLRQGGHDAELALSGEAALQRLRDAHFDAISVDLLLPDMTGVEFVHALRARPKTAQLPVIIISGVVEQAQRVLGDQISAVAWLNKPVDSAQLLGAVQQCLARPAQPRVLHVEDDADLRAVLRLLGKDVAELQPAASLAEARARLQEARYAAVILDVGLPDGSGLELLPDLRALDPAPGVILLTGNDPSDAAVSGVAAVLVKSRCDEKQLLATLRQVLAR